MVSVGRRLFVLVTIQAAIALLLVGVAVRTIARFAADYRHLYDCQFKSVAAIAQAMAEAETLKPGFKSAVLDGFYHRYRTEWETASRRPSDVLRFRKDLLDAGASDLPRLETEALGDLGTALGFGDVESARRDLANLYVLNIRLAELENYYLLRRIK